MSMLRVLLTGTLVLMAGCSWAGGDAATETVTLTDAVNRFGSEFFQGVAEPGANLCFSPVSIALAVSQLAAGAQGQTAHAIHRHLPERLSVGTLHQAWAGLLGELGANSASTTACLASKIWSASDLLFTEQFQTTMQTCYGVTSESLSFSTAPEEARATINRWVAGQTQGKIPELLPAGMLAPDTRLVLTNALYFKDLWASQFAPARTQPATFAVSASQSVPVALMHGSDDYQYAEVNGAQLLRLPFSDKTFELVVFLPAPESDCLDWAREAFHPATMEALLSRSDTASVEVYLPRLRVAQTMDLKKALAALGLSGLFSPQAELRGMCPAEQVYFSAAVHEVVMELTEEGAEAAAATAMAAKRALPKVFRADRPFAFLLRHTPSGINFFMGLVTNPEG